MVTGILVANRSIIREAMLDLQSTAKLELDMEMVDGRLRLPQVHALNCLKDIFTNTRLGEATEVFLEDTLTIAVDRLGHHV